MYIEVPGNLGRKDTNIASIQLSLSKSILFEMLRLLSMLSTSRILDTVSIILTPQVDLNLNRQSIYSVDLV